MPTSRATAAVSTIPTCGVTACSARSSTTRRATASTSSGASRRVTGSAPASSLDEPPRPRGGGDEQADRHGSCCPAAVPVLPPRPLGVSGSPPTTLLIGAGRRRFAPLLEQTLVPVSSDRVTTTRQRLLSSPPATRSRPRIVSPGHALITPNHSDQERLGISLVSLTAQTSQAASRGAQRGADVHRRKAVYTGPTPVRALASWSQIQS